MGAEYSDKEGKKIIPQSKEFQRRCYTHPNYDGLQIVRYLGNELIGKGLIQDNAEKKNQRVKKKFASKKLNFDGEKYSERKPVHQDEPSGKKGNSAKNELDKDFKVENDEKNEDKIKCLSHDELHNLTLFQGNKTIITHQNKLIIYRFI